MYLPLGGLAQKRTPSPLAKITRPWRTAVAGSRQLEACASTGRQDRVIVQLSLWRSRVGHECRFETQHPTIKQHKQSRRIDLQPCALGLLPSRARVESEWRRECLLTKARRGLLLLPLSSRSLFPMPVFFTVRSRRAFSASMSMFYSALIFVIK